MKATNTEYRVHGRLLTPGTEISVAGERGRFLFDHISRQRRRRVTPVCRRTGRCRRMARVPPERVRTVHRINKTRTNRKEVNHDA
ncbi:MAG: DUF7246 family protein [Haloechinothrix sp.]